MQNVSAGRVDHVTCSGPLLGPNSITIQGNEGVTSSFKFRVNEKLFLKDSIKNLFSQSSKYSKGLFFDEMLPFLTNKYCKMLVFFTLAK